VKIILFVGFAALCGVAFSVGWYLSDRMWERIRNKRFR